MGRKTWESIPEKFRPLPGRTNVVLTSRNSMDVPKDVIVASSLEDATAKLDEQAANLGSVFVIGGAQVYEQAIKKGFVSKVIYTEVSNLPDDAKFDVFFPDLTESGEWEANDMMVSGNDKENSENSNTKQVDAKSGLAYQFLEYSKRPKAISEEKDDSKASSIPASAKTNTEEMQYLDLCRDILASGVRRGDRTGTGTLSKFGTQMRFSLRDGTLPLLTTKRTFWRGVAEELLWFISVR